MTEISSVELHKKLGKIIDQARVEPVVITKHERPHVVMVSAEKWALMQEMVRKVRKTGSLTPEERAAAAAAEVPSEAEQKKFLAKLSAASKDAPNP